jgi:LuxR family maltose regulon positive regulatory protein
MTRTLLTTKLHIPRTRPELVPRPRLIEQLNAGSHCKLALISAPAGFGKTTLLSEWATRTRRPVCWVSLDEGDNDPTRFWAYCIAALQTVRADIGNAVLAAIQSSGFVQPKTFAADTPLSFEPLLTGLINETSEIPDPIVLILDDFHAIANQQINAGMTFLLDNAPPQMHLVIATRADPPLQLSRLRGRGQLNELRAADLCFTLDETAAFLNEMMGLDLSAEDVAELELRTEGWIVGLQMAALSMQGRSRERVSDFVASFTGSHRHVLHYLTEEVLQRQPEGVQTFMLQTAILDRLCGPLCDTVTDQSGSQAVLERLERANLFIIPLDDEQHWYRYHHLFADLLRNRLGKVHPDEVPTLHRRASEWYEGKELLPEAISHALAGEDVERAIRLIEGDALAMLDQGELATVLGWLDALPDEVVRSRPWLCVAYAWVLAYGGRLDALGSVLQDAEKTLDRLGRVSGLSALDRRHVEGHIAIIRAYSANMLGDLVRAEKLAQEALERLPDEDLKTRGLAATMRALLLYARGDVALANPAFDEALTISRAVGDPHLTVHILCERVLFQLAQGRLRQAADTCREALQLAEESARQGGRPLPIASYAHTRMANVLREWNDLEAALYHARESVRLSKRWGQTDILLTGYFDLAWVLQATGDVEGALDAIREAQQIARDASGQDYFPLERAEAQIQLMYGDVAAAARWIAQMGLSVEDEFDCFQGFTYLTLARLLLTQADWQPGESLERALRLLKRILLQAETVGYMRLAIQTLILQALALQAKGDVGQALNSLERALVIAEPEGFVRSFIDMGMPMGELLRQAAVRGIAIEYVGKLLAALDAESVRARVPGSKPSRSELVEPLTKRELEVLRLLATGLSNKDIASTLSISVTTAKKHLQNIYGKLQVHRRTEAVARARALDLL